MNNNQNSNTNINNNKINKINDIKDNNYGNSSNSFPMVIDNTNNEYYKMKFSSLDSSQMVPYEVAFNFAAMNQGMLPYNSMRYRSKKDNLRKGKWTPEEELYTNKIIESFNLGLLRLPENTNGITLRSYLAEKLGCDPMRITKKYTGASCLGKRVYHKEAVSSTTADEMEKTQKELELLESKFKERLEQVRLERREHETAIEGLYNQISISTPNIDALMIHNGGYPQNSMSASNNMNGGPFTYPHGMSSVNSNFGMQNGFNPNSYYSNHSSTTSSLPIASNNSSALSSANLLNNSQMYMQMLAACGPYIKPSEAALQMNQNYYANHLQMSSMQQLDQLHSSDMKGNNNNSDGSNGSYFSNSNLSDSNSRSGSSDNNSNISSRQDSNSDGNRSDSNSNRSDSNSNRSDEDPSDGNRSDSNSNGSDDGRGSSADSNNSKKRSRDTTNLNHASLGNKSIKSLRKENKSRSISNRSDSVRSDGNQSSNGRSDISGNTTNEDKNDNASGGNSNYSKKGNNNISNKSDSSSDSSSTENLEEDNFLSSINDSDCSQNNNKNSQHNHSNKCGQSNKHRSNENSRIPRNSSSSSGTDDDKDVASSLLGLFNHIKRSSTHQDLVEFVEDVQKSVSTTSSNKLTSNNQANKNSESSSKNNTTSGSGSSSGHTSTSNHRKRLLSSTTRVSSNNIKQHKRSRDNEIKKSNSIDNNLGNSPSLTNNMLFNFQQYQNYHQLQPLYAQYQQHINNIPSALSPDKLQSSQQQFALSDDSVTKLNLIDSKAKANPSCEVASSQESVVSNFAEVIPA